jgi:hypothetical protein
VTLEQLAALFDLAQGHTGRWAENVFEHLAQDNLVDRDDDAVWEVTDRGRVFVEHVRALPLPERAWRMPMAHRIAPNAGAFMEDFAAFGTAALHINGIEEEEGEPPKGPMPKPFARKIDIPSDPELLRALASQLLDNGMSMGEVERELNLTPEQATAFFRGR